MKTIMTILVTLITLISYSQTSGFDTNINKTRKEIKELEKGNVKFDIDVTIDNKSIKDTSYMLDIVNYNTGVVTNLTVSNNFILFLDYNTEFEVSVSYKGANMKTILIDTNAPVDNWYITSGINLNSKKTNRVLAGGIKYDKKAQTFKKFK